MKYKKDFYLIVGYVTFWLYKYYTTVSSVDNPDIRMFIGLDSGYNYIWIVATVILAIGIVYADCTSELFYEISLLKVSRKVVLIKTIRKYIGLIVKYLIFYNGINVVLCTMFLGTKMMNDNNAYLAIMAFFIAQLSAYLCMTLLYIIITILYNNKYVSLIVVFAVSSIVTFLEVYKGLRYLSLYTNMSLEKFFVGSVDFKFWILTTISQIIFDYICYLIIKEMYLRKDIINVHIV